MNVGKAIRAIIGNVCERVSNEECAAAMDYLRSLEKAPQWLRHEGGERPEGVEDSDIVAVMYEADRQTVGGFAGDRNWVVPLWYYVIPAPPAPPKKWTVDTVAFGNNILRKNGDSVYSLSCFTPAEQNAIVDALNKMQGGGE